MNKSRSPRRPALLVILDGFGCNPSAVNNAVIEASTPNFDRCFGSHPHTVLQASGRAVGLPDGQMGNSEVGHMTIGCGSVVRQDLVRIDEAISSGEFYTNKVLCDAVDAATESGGRVHLIGLASEGGVHSHLRHLFALLELCRRRGAVPVLHAITDGRDTSPKAAIHQLSGLQECMSRSNGQLGTVCGRFYAMDRDRRWKRTEAAWRCMVYGEGARAATLKVALESSYAAGLNDEFVRPTVLGDYSPMASEDQVIVFNFRRDRPRQLVSALFREDFDGFDRGDYRPLPVTCMTEYDHWFGLPYAFEQDRPKTTLAQEVSRAGLRQFHCAETEKYAHVTFFLNGGRGDLHPGEVHHIVDSPKVETYDLCPEMSAAGVADEVIKAMQGGEFDFIVVNFANGDMVGHTAVREAVLEAVVTLDREVGRVLDAAGDCGFSVMLTADHGNCDEMVNPVTGGPQTQHTVYPVPCLIVDETAWRLGIGAGLDSIAPTLLQLMGLPVPKEMEGHSLLLGPVCT